MRALKAEGLGVVVSRSLKPGSGRVFLELEHEVIVVLINAAVFDAARAYDPTFLSLLKEEVRAARCAAGIVGVLDAAR